MGLHDIHLGHRHRHMVIEDLVQEDQPAHAPSLLEGVQFQCPYDISDTSPWVVVGGDPSCSSLLDLLQLINVLNEVRVPHSAGILEAAPYHGVIGKPFEVVGTSSQVAFDEPELLVHSGLEFAYVGSPCCVTGKLQGTAPAQWTLGWQHITHRNALGGFFPCGQT